MNNTIIVPTAHAAGISRRRFVQGLALGGAAALLGGISAPAMAAPGIRRGQVLRGNEYHLTIGESPVNFTGRQALATTIHGGVPGPLLRWREGSEVTLHVHNTLRVPTALHWHGILLPYRMDGVPGLSFPGIAPGETFTYRFAVRQSGTYWYHAHAGFQEQTGLYAPLLIEPAAGERFAADREHVVLLSDWSDMAPERVFEILKTRSDYFAASKPTIGQFLRDAAAHGLDDALAARAMWNRMRMSPRDLVDVGGTAYTYLLNGTTPAGNWTGLFAAGETVRLRLINGSANSIFDLRIPGLSMRVVAADGQDVEPVTVDELRFSPGETYDVLVRPDDHAYTLFAQSIDRSGYACGTLAPREGLRAAIPAMDPVPRLAMVDMMGTTPHAQHGGAGGLGGHGAMPHAMPGMGQGSVQARHASSEFDNPGAAMRIDFPRTNLDDPGAGLRNNGRRVLSYADLHSIGDPVAREAPTREIELHLTGNMERFMWSFDGIKLADATPVHFPRGKTVRVVLSNDTMMTHPIHLHGMWSELETPQGEFLVRKHTLNVQPAQRISFLVQADPPGRWAWHCHLLYHMTAGMFREVVVA